MEARRRYERLSGAELDKYKSIITLEDYSDTVRARILYHHLFFSNLPQNLKTALLPDQRYWRVIQHRNYNPRVIEHAIDLPNEASSSPREFVANIFGNLNDPSRIWENIFENLPIMARRTLLAVASLPYEVLLEDVQRVVKSLAPRDFEAGDFRNALNMIEGTFIQLREGNPGYANRQRVVTFRNPSVRDYFWARLEAVEGEADALLGAAVFFEQCVILYTGRRHVMSRARTYSYRAFNQMRDPNIINHEAVAVRATELIGSDSPVLSQWRYSDDDAVHYVRESPSLERRTAFLMDIYAKHETNQVVAQSALAALEATIECWDQENGSSNEGLDLLNQIERIEGLVDEDTFERAGRALLALVTSHLHKKEDFETLVGLASLFPCLFTDRQCKLQSLSTEFCHYIEGQRDWLLEEIDDADWLEAEFDKIRDIASDMELDISELETDVKERLKELRVYWEPDSEDDIPDLYLDPEDDSDMSHIDALFQSLR